jgi:hypothetical protein
LDNTPELEEDPQGEALEVPEVSTRTSSDDNFIVKTTTSLRGATTKVDQAVDRFTSNEGYAAHNTKQLYRFFPANCLENYEEQYENSLSTFAETVKLWEKVSLGRGVTGVFIPPTDDQLLSLWRSLISVVARAGKTTQFCSVASLFMNKEGNRSPNSAYFKEWSKFNRFTRRVQSRLQNASGKDNKDTQIWNLLSSLSSHLQRVFRIELKIPSQYSDRSHANMIDVFQRMKMVEQEIEERLKPEICSFLRSKECGSVLESYRISEMSRNCFNFLGAFLDLRSLFQAQVVCKQWCFGHRSSRLGGMTFVPIKRDQMSHKLHLKSVWEVFCLTHFPGPFWLEYDKRYDGDARDSVGINRPADHFVPTGLNCEVGELVRNDSAHSSIGIGSVKSLPGNLAESAGNLRWDDREFPSVSGSEVKYLPSSLPSFLHHFPSSLSFLPSSCINFLPLLPSFLPSFFLSSFL